MFYNICTVKFAVIRSCEEKYAPQLPPTCYEGSKRVVLPWENKDGARTQEPLEHNDAAEEVLHCITSATFSTLHLPVENSQLYTLKHEELSD